MLNPALAELWVDEVKNLREPPKPPYIVRASSVEDRNC
jgi:hypothetical protein